MLRVLAIIMALSYVICNIAALIQVVCATSKTKMMSNINYFVHISCLISNCFRQLSSCTPIGSITIARNCGLQKVKFCIIIFMK